MQIIRSQCESRLKDRQHYIAGHGERIELGALSMSIVSEESKGSRRDVGLYGGPIG